MQREFGWVLGVVLLASGCGKAKSREAGPGSGAPAATAPPGAPTPPAPGPDEAPPPPSAMVGKNRLINLWQDAAGATVCVDVWSLRGLYAPKKVVDHLELGQVSPWFGVPEHVATAIVKCGAGASGEALAPAATGEADEIVTGVLLFEDGRSVTTALYDKSSRMSQAIVPPAPGKGLVVLDAGQLRPFGATMEQRYGGTAFYVGDGAGACATQRLPPGVTDGALLGGTNQVQVELPPGHAKLSIHKWDGGPAEACAKPALVELGVDVVADQAQWVFLYTPDAGKTITSLAAPIGTP